MFGCVSVGVLGVWSGVGGVLCFGKDLVASLLQHSRCQGSIIKKRMGI